MFRPFLTDLDSRAAVKGSRDPLGIQALWTGLGRHVVGNLTTGSISVRDFTITLLGYYFAGKVSEITGPGRELATFLKWEQLAAYVRAEINDDWVFRGTERVGTRLSESTRVTLSADRNDQILGNQKIYGLWGLYTVPSRSSGLLEDQTIRLSPPSIEHWQQVLEPQLAIEGFGDGAEIVRMLAQDRLTVDLKGKNHRLAVAIARVLKLRLLPREKDFYREHLLFGGPNDMTGGVQRQLVELFKPHLAVGDFPWSPRALTNLTREAVKRGKSWERLAQGVQRISVAETVFAPVAALFTYFLGSDGTPISELEKRVNSEWGPRVKSVDADAFALLEGELAHGNADVGRRWTAMAYALANGSYADLIRLLLEQNRHIMQSRGSAGPWVEESRGRLVVKMQDERGELPARQTLPDLWRHSYFLDSLFTVASAMQ